MAGNTSPGRGGGVARAAGLALALALGQGAASADYPVTASQSNTARQVARAGVPLDELAADAPSRYTIRHGDTLWGISGLYLKRPWRWPELWGMNLSQIGNPHLIYPGQVLVLTLVDGRAHLSLAKDSALPTVRLSPRVRAESLAEAAIPPVPLERIAPFLNEALIVDDTTLAGAARIVAASEDRVLLSQGNRAYARGQQGAAGSLSGEPLRPEPGQSRQLRVFRNAVPLRDPASGEILGYEAQYLGQAELERGETLRETATTGHAARPEIVPATLSITRAREEIRIGDRLLREPARELPAFVPHAPDALEDGQIVSIYGNAVRFAGQNQVVTINRGLRDGVERGHVLALLRDSGTLSDSTDADRPVLRLPGERNGLMIVFRTFERVSYALVLQISDGVKVGDRFTRP